MYLAVNVLQRIWYVFFWQQPWSWQRSQWIMIGQCTASLFFMTPTFKGWVRMTGMTPTFKGWARMTGSQFSCNFAYLWKFAANFYFRDPSLKIRLSHLALFLPLLMLFEISVDLFFFLYFFLLFCNMCDGMQVYEAKVGDELMSKVQTAGVTKTGATYLISSRLSSVWWFHDRFVFSGLWNRSYSKEL